MIRSSILLSAGKFGWLVSFLFLSLSSGLPAQSAKIDSLKRVLSRIIPTDARRGPAILELANASLRTFPERAKQLGLEALKLAEKKGNMALVADAQLLIGRYCLSTRSYDEAHERFEKSRMTAIAMTDTNRIADALFGIGCVSEMRRAYEKAVEYYRRSLALKRQVGREGETADILFHLGSAYESLYQYQRAAGYLRQCIEVREKRGEAQALANLYWHLGILYDNLGESSKAIEALQRGLGTARESGEANVVPDILNSLGVIYRNMGDYDKALEFYKRSLKAQESNSDSAKRWYGTANTLKNIGDVRMWKGDYARALEDYRQSLEMSEMSGNNRLSAGIMQSMGIVFEERGSYDSALSFNGRALRIYESLDDRGGIGAVLNNIGTILFTTQSYDSALVFFLRAEPLLREVGNKKHLANALNNIGLIRDNQGQTNEALKYLQESQSVREEIGDRPGIAESLGNIGEVYMRIGEYEKALEWNLRCLKILEAVESGKVPLALYNIGAIYIDIGYLLKTKEYHQKAMNYMVRSLRASEEQGNRQQMAHALNGMGDVAFNLGDLDTAMTYYRNCMELCRELGDKRLLSGTLVMMARVHAQSGRHDTAHAYLRNSLAVLEELGDQDISGALLQEARSLLKQRAFDGAELYLLRALDLGRKSGSRLDRKEAHAMLSTFYEQQGNMSEALRHFKELASVKDSLLNEKNLKNINDLDARYENEKKGRQIALLENEKISQALELKQRTEELLLRRMEVERQKHNLRLAEEEREKKDLQLQGTQAELRAQQAESGEQKNKAELVSLNLSREQEQRQVEVDRRNYLLAVSLLSILLAAVLVNRYQHKKRASDLRAETAEYQAQAAEAQAMTIAMETERRERHLQERFSRNLLESQERERKRIAGDLHDSVVQEMLVIRTQLMMALEDAAGDRRVAERLSKATESTSTLLEDVRRISRNLRPVQLERAGLTATLRETLALAMEAREPRLEWRVDDIDGLFNPEEEINLYRVVQEGLNNIAKHAGASHAEVRIIREEESLKLFIGDDGRGFDPSAGEKGKGLGLRGMAERIGILGGSLRIETAPGKGTRIMAETPVRERMTKSG